MSPTSASHVNTAPGAAPAPAPPRLLDSLRHAVRVRHYSIRTEDTYLDWVRLFILLHGKRHPRDLGGAEVAAFLAHLAVERGVAPSTQNQAKSALLFLYREVLQIELPWLDEVIAAMVQRRLPVVLTPSEARALLHQLSGTMGLVCSLLYGTGMRVLEGLRLRVKDVGFERREIVVRDVLPLQQQLSRARALHDRDLQEGLGRVWLPDALSVKYPGAARTWGWQWVFPSAARSADLRSTTMAAACPAPSTRSSGSHPQRPVRRPGSAREARSGSAIAARAAVAHRCRRRCALPPRTPPPPRASSG